MAAQGLPTTRRVLLAGAGALALAPPQPALGQAAPGGAATAPPSWPHTVGGPGGSATIYQPQVISWPGQTTLNARAAVAVTRPGSNRPVLGTLEVTARTTTDMATRTVALDDLRLVSSRFPALDTGQAAQLEARLRAALATVASRTVPLDTVLLSLRNGADAPPDDPAVDNDPPAIFHSARPASLVVFDGEPVLARIPNSPLSIAVNTNWSVLSDPEGGWWLLNNGSWMTAPRPAGPWMAAATLPAALRSLPDDQNLADIRRAIPGRPFPPDAVPTIFVSTKPAEIIVTDGPPRFTAIPGTRVEMVANSAAPLFRDPGTGRFYVLASGRWFAAASLDGPWRFATPDLPPDFAQIPPDSVAGGVLPAVPGTAQAAEAVLQAQIPRTATLDRATAKLEVAYLGGPPQFRPIPGTGIRYAVNTRFAVLEIAGRYYCCEDGVWFTAAAPTGPWTLAEATPPGLHRIPPSHPLHHVTYVQVQAATPGTVTYGYTAGYLGGMVTAGVLVYGTGYAYPPVVLPGPVPIYLPYPYTYGGAVHYAPATGTWVRGGTVYGPYGGVATGGTAYNPATGAWARGGAVYGPYGGACAFSAYNPQTGAYAHGSAAWGPDGGSAVASAYNPATGRSASTSQNWNPYSRWGSSTVSGPNQTVNTQSAANARGQAGAFSSSTGAEGAGVRGAGGNSAGAVRTQGGNVYAGADGNVYRNTGDGWQKDNNGSWQPVTPPARNSGGGQQPASLGGTQPGGRGGQAGTGEDGLQGRAQGQSQVQPEARSQPQPRGEARHGGG
ncbi:MAG: hypothetical protein K2X49_08130, partial [Acetobacteraceae bacterium]|nr:hypothetical protein [Acetobacteraceae bacterium]